MIEYLIIIALVEFMVYMALRIVHAFAILFESDEIEARELSQEEFEKLMQVFGGEKDD